MDIKKEPEDVFTIEIDKYASFDAKNNFETEISTEKRHIKKEKETDLTGQQFEKYINMIKYTVLIRHTRFRRKIGPDNSFLKCQDGEKLAPIKSEPETRWLQYKDDFLNSQTDILNYSNRFADETCSEASIKNEIPDSGDLLRTKLPTVCRKIKQEKKDKTSVSRKDRIDNSKFETNESCNITIDEQDLKKECKKSSTVKDFLCEICHESFDCDDSLASHRPIHDECPSDGKRFACNFCSFRSKKSNSLKRHLMIHSNEKPYSCKICNFKCRQLVNLTSHILIHNGEKPFMCGICNSKFRRKAVLKTHELIHKNLKPIACDLCAFTCRRTGDLNTHKIIHNDSRPFKCADCDYTGKTTVNLKKHRLIHSDVLLFTCPFCSLKFRSSSNLRRHKLIHQDLKPLKCETCEYVCKRPCELRVHSLVHTDFKPFACDVCDSRFKCAASLKMHKIVHSCVLPYGCPDCVFKTKRLSNLKRHRLTRHEKSVQNPTSNK